MIELTNDTLVFSFPELHAHAVLHVEFQRTLRIPSDGRTYPLPPGRGRFPLRHVDDFGEKVPPEWLRHGGVMLPMYQAEAMWLRFHSPTGYPFAIKVAAGKINAVTGEPWDDGLERDPQNYVVHPGQPWLDGYVVTKGTVRQFVAMPLGAGYSAEEQITGKAEFGGLQIQVFPLRAERWVPPRPVFRPAGFGGLADYAIPPAPAMAPAPASSPKRPSSAAPDMALGMGGSMKQDVYQDTRPLADWDTARAGRCFVHLANAMVWRQVTGAEPPTVPPTAKEYTDAGLPWFDYYAHDRAAVEGSATLANLQTIAEMADEKGEVALPENASVTPGHVVPLRSGLAPNEVREGTF
jgi:hypothetical protein